MRKIFKKKRAQKVDVTQFLKRRGKVRLNIGCGTDYKKGWINIDNNSDNNIEKLDLNWDMKEPLPFPDNSVDFIFNEHFFEHIPVEDAVRVMSDLRRVLKPGGVMRIAMPDLESVIDHYLHVPLEEDQVIKDHGFEFVKTPAEWINMSFRWWGHEWLYDWEELQRRLKSAGFKKMKRCKHSKSTYKELEDLEIRQGSLLIAEVIK